MTWRRSSPPRLATLVGLSALAALVAAALLFASLMNLPQVLDRQTHITLQHQASWIAARYVQAFETEFRGPAGMDIAGENEHRRTFARYASNWDLVGPAIPLKLSLALATLRDSRMRSEPVDQELLPAEAQVLEKIDFRRMPPAQKDEALRIAGDAIEAQLEVLAEQTLAGLSIIDHHGDVVASSVPAWRGRNAAVGIREVRATLGDGHRHAARRRRHLPEASAGPLARFSDYQISLAVPIWKDGFLLGAVHILRTPRSVQDLLKDLGPSVWFGIALPFLLLTMTLLAAIRFFAVLPIRSLVAQVDPALTSAAARERPIPQPRSREVGELSQAVAQMARSMRKQAEEASAQADDLVHSIKNSLLPVRQATSELLSEGEAMSTSERRTATDRISSGLDRVMEHSLKVLEFANSGLPNEEARGPTDLKDVLAELEEAGRTVEICGLGGLPDLPMVAIERTSLGKILDRLFENAQQAGAHSVDITIRQRADALVLRCADDGPGVPEQHRATIFQRGFTTRSASAGTGLGLATARRLAERAGGALYLDPSQHGAAFELVIPLPPDL
ncbi:MAG: HAMP domain-containing sensor histidine kinase [Deltaproteobacteria bacterium]